MPIAANEMCDDLLQDRSSLWLTRYFPYLIAWQRKKWEIPQREHAMQNGATPKRLERHAKGTSLYTRVNDGGSLTYVTINNLNPMLDGLV